MVEVCEAICRVSSDLVLLEFYDGRHSQKLSDHSLMNGEIVTRQKWLHVSQVGPGREKNVATWQRAAHGGGPLPQVSTCGFKKPAQQIKKISKWPLLPRNLDCRA